MHRRVQWLRPHLRVWLSTLQLPLVACLSGVGQGLLRRGPWPLSDPVPMHHELPKIMTFETIRRFGLVSTYLDHFDFLLGVERH